MTVANRETLRDGIVTDMKTLTGLADDAGSVAHVFGGLPQTFDGLSPCCTVENGGWRPDLAGDIYDPTPVRFIIGFWQRIDARASAEDALDLFAIELFNKLRSKYNARFYDTTMPFYELMDGIDYRGEYHFVEVLW